MTSNPSVTEEMIDRMVESWPIADAHQSVRGTCRDLLDAALAAPQHTGLTDVERVTPWLQHKSHCLAQQDLHDDTLCRCGLDDALGSGAVLQQPVHADVERTRGRMDGRTAADGLDISIFVEAHGGNTRAHFQSQHIDDPAPFLKRAIGALQAELADLDKCPVHADEGKGQ